MNTEWKKPILKKVSINEMIEEITAKATSTCLGCNCNESCQIEFCWYLANCDILPVA